MRNLFLLLPLLIAVQNQAFGAAYPMNVVSSDGAFLTAEHVSLEMDSKTIVVSYSVYGSRGFSPYVTHDDRFEITSAKEVECGSMEYTAIFRGTGAGRVQGLLSRYTVTVRDHTHRFCKDRRPAFEAFVEYQGLSLGLKEAPTRTSKMSLVSQD